MKDCPNSFACDFQHGICQHCGTRQSAFKDEQVPTKQEAPVSEACAAVREQEPEPYFVVFGIRDPMAENWRCSTNPEEFLLLVAEFMDGRTAPCNARAEICAVSMPLQRVRELQKAQTDEGGTHPVSTGEAGEKE